MQVRGRAERSPRVLGVSVGCVTFPPCRDRPGHMPRRQDLAGVWIVDQGNFFAGRMLIELNADGTFAMDPGTSLFSAPGAYGVFTYRSGSLTLATRGGRDCQPGDRSLWQVGLMSDGRLRLKVITFYDSVCTVEAGEVWIARRVSVPAHLPAGGQAAISRCLRRRPWRRPEVPAFPRKRPAQ